MTIFINVTTSAKWARPPVGIVRVEQEISLYYINSSKPVTLFYISGQAIYEINSEMYVSSLGISDCTSEHLNPEISFDMINKNDTIITAGLDWDTNALFVLERLKRIAGADIITCCYDMIPVKLVQFTCLPDISHNSEYYIKMALLSDVVLCISKSTESDFLEFCRSSGIEAPVTHIFKMGSMINKQEKFAIEKLPISPELEWIKTKSYILFVSTIESRKNHAVLYHAYLYLLHVKKLETRELPFVVFVGMQGWGVNDFLTQVKADKSLSSKFIFMNKVDDNLLNLLYINSLFTVYPSIYEGWGLPVVESLSLGKFVLCSVTSSLPEAGGHYCEYVNPFNAEAWALAIIKYSSNSQLLKEKEAEIKSNFNQVSWDESLVAMDAFISKKKSKNNISTNVLTFYDNFRILKSYRVKGSIAAFSSGLVCEGPSIYLSPGHFRLELCIEYCNFMGDLICVLPEKCHFSSSRERLVHLFPPDLSDPQSGKVSVTIDFLNESVSEAWDFQICLGTHLELSGVCHLWSCAITPLSSDGCSASIHDSPGSNIKYINNMIRERRYLDAEALLLRSKDNIPGSLFDIKMDEIKRYL